MMTLWSDDARPTACATDQHAVEHCPLVSVGVVDLRTAKPTLAVEAAHHVDSAVEDGHPGPGAGGVHGRYGRPLSGQRVEPGTETCTIAWGFILSLEPHE